MIKKTNKKGFTLAELLIVVAIIAVLVAIAVPLFVGVLNDAEEKVQAANIRVVRVAATEKILLDQQKSEPEFGDGTESGWYVKATIDKSGNITAMYINADQSKTGTWGETAPFSTEGKITKDDKGNDVVFLLIKDLEPDSSMFN